MPSDRADELAHTISARYYFSLTAFTRDEMDAAIATVMRAYAAEQLAHQRLRYRYGPTDAQIMFGLTGRREFTLTEAAAVVRAAIAGEAANAD